MVISEKYGILDGIDNIDLIYHLSTLPRIQPSFEEPTPTIDTNVTGTINEY